MAVRPVVSIITPTYNHERFIGQCIQSVLSQTYPYWEQIIIDDGSTDRTAKIATGYNDDRITYTRQENRGIWRLKDTYNDALRRSKGEYIAILEGDDFWPPNKLERQMEPFHKSNAVISWGRGALTDSKGNISSYRPDDISPFLCIPRQDMLRDLLFHNPITACTVICRKSALNAIGGFKQPDYVPYLDRPTWLELGLKGDFLVIDEILGYYRMHEHQVTTTMKRAMFKASKHTALFYSSLSPEDRKAIAGTGCGPESLDSRLAESFYYFGRACLIEENWDEAAKNFRKALALCGPKMKVKAALGQICSYCRTDMEWAARIMKTPRLDD
ncbi:MAG: glycosyltransferase [Methanothrix sp.]